MFAVLEKAIQYRIENCYIKAKVARKNLSEETICSKMPNFIGYSRKCNMRHAKYGQNELSNITFCS